MDGCCVGKFSQAFSIELIGPVGLLSPPLLECLPLTEEKATIPAHASAKRTEKLLKNKNLFLESLQKGWLK